MKMQIRVCGWIPESPGGGGGGWVTGYKSKDPVCNPQLGYKSKDPSVTCNPGGRGVGFFADSNA
jgi:hypothetical protein